jgi:hypothetical protein
MSKSKRDLAKFLKISNPRLDVKTPHCPLCHEFMVREFRPKQACYVFACRGDVKKVGAVYHRSIAIRVDDPFVGRWDEAVKEENELLCPNPRCDKYQHEKLRFFGTRTGYMLAMCPVCGAGLTNMEPDRPKEKFYSPEAPSVGQTGAPAAAVDAPSPNEGTA